MIIHGNTFPIEILYLLCNLYFCPWMTLLYNTGLFFLRLGFSIAAFFHPKASAFVKGRKNLFRELEIAFRQHSGKLVWVHCASLGEFEQGRPVIELLKKENPALKILVTFFSPSGYEVRKKYALADHVFYLPWDTSQNAHKFISITNPTVAIFVKYEFWHHYSRVLHARNIPLLSICSIFRPDQMFFKRYGGFYRSILEKFSYFFVQNEVSLNLLRAIGIQRCMMAGDTRFDRVYAIVHQGGEIPIIKSFKSDQKTMVVGSCWEEDLAVLAPFINEDKMKFIIAPHEISESFLKAIEESLHVKSIRYSAISNTSPENYQVLIIDNIGMLSRLYRYGEYAYVGGAFGKGLHNILEAACYGVPVFFGNNNYEKFKEAVDLINRGGAFPITDYNELKSTFEMLAIPENFLLACDVTRAYILENLGATEKIMEYCRKLLK